MTARETPLRVVLDLSAMLEALLQSTGPAVALRQGWEQGTLRPLICAETAARLMRALRFPDWHLSEAEQQELLADVLPYTEVVTDVPPLNAPGLDRESALLVALAVRGEAELLISDRPALATWAQRRRHPLARNLCELRALADWKPA